MDCQITDQFKAGIIKKQEAFLLFADRDLIDFVKHVRSKGLQLGKDVGLISYDDTPMKEILEGGITVISTDFELMGQTLSKIIDQKLTTKTANPSTLIQRKSL